LSLAVGNPLLTHLSSYNEKIVDLLATGSLDKVTCDIRMDPVTKLPFVSGLTQRQVEHVDDVVKTLADGDANRSVAATAMNSQSSRSHLLLQIVVSSKNHLTGTTTTGKLTLVDLAGSERVSKSEATGQRLVEAAAINKSLSALGQVFTSLRTAQSHIPYRNSKLTHILQDSLGGDAKCCVFINISPAESNLPETIGTLKFGQV
jgi:kinesin family protein C2/C3